MLTYLRDGKCTRIYRGHARCVVSLLGTRTSQHRVTLSTVSVFISEEVRY